ncbi:hypothetical protein H6G76_35690 [Nostoc sp. FACHB-152]|uniref:hypothetical protein n=1 Tax=unclassified Nostoc TaxID=2593658 RepID=UPI001686F23C|nr:MULTISPECIES: hypothetical protein [unclassified Nostoc]MBD2452354.1 hypothetical protein [Nostoc sp. FACHB-152]MBD2472317.1 hypothetical protein [Nostoc sp. FACHB-145]
MLNQDVNLKTKTLKTIFATIHLGLISLGLVSCVVQAPKLPEATSPQKEQYNNQNQSQPREDRKKDDDDHDDDNNDKDNDKDNDND